MLTAMHHHPPNQERANSWWCPSVNSFKFQLCNHTSPGTHIGGEEEVVEEIDGEVEVVVYLLSQI